MHRLTLRTRVLVVNVGLVAATALVAAVLTTLDLESIGPRSIVFAVAAVVVAAVVNTLVLRSGLQPLNRLVDTMEKVDLSEPGLRAPSGHGSTPEVKRISAAFNRMLDRIEDERRAAGRAVLKAQEEERARIAQELHDEVNQALTGVLLRLTVSASDAPVELRRELEETRQLASQAMDELLGIARRLRPTVLGDHGLVPALHSQVQEFARKTHIDASFHRHGAIPPLDEEQQLVIYRVCQEALSNAAKHACATQVTVDLSFTGRTILRVSDNGSGFEPTATDGRTNGRGRPLGRAGSLGLSGMHERAMMIGGRLQFFSRPGQGTTVELTMGGS